MRLPCTGGGVFLVNRPFPIPSICVRTGPQNWNVAYAMPHNEPTPAFGSLLLPVSFCGVQMPDTSGTQSGGTAAGVGGVVGPLPLRFRYAGNQEPVTAQESPSGGLLGGLGAAALWCFSTLPRGSHGGKIKRRGATSTGVWSVMLCLATPTAPRFILNVGSQGMTQGKRDDRTQGTSGG
jgi:hypothetical protein